MFEGKKCLKKLNFAEALRSDIVININIFFGISFKIKTFG